LHKKALLIIAAGLIIVVAASLLTWHSLFSQQDTPKYKTLIDRSFGTSQEENALKAAEAVNYSNITATERFQGSGNPEDYRNPGAYLDYTYANFIDKEVINYYQTRYDDQQGQVGSKYPLGITFTYQANATAYSDFQIYNTPAPENVTWHNITIVKCTPDGYDKYDSGNMYFYCRNQSSYQMTQWNYSFNFTDCYVVELKLHYSEYYAPLAAFFSDVYQIVVLDQNLTPVMVGVESQKVIS
jgi:hypothetical protein